VTLNKKKRKHTQHLEDGNAWLRSVTKHWPAEVCGGAHYQPKTTTLPSQAGVSSASPV
jgi:hypothetical protein